MLYYFTEHDTIYCKVVGGDNNFKGGYEFFTHYKSLMENEMSKEMNEFLDKVDALCFEYGYEIHPTIHGWTGKTDENGKYKTIAIIGNDEIGEVIYIDGDGRGK